VEAAGFTLEASSDLLKNPDDAHNVPVFDPSIRGNPTSSQCGSASPSDLTEGGYPPNMRLNRLGCSIGANPPEDRAPPAWIERGPPKLEIAAAC